jgi:hypothetical protein
MKFLKALAIVFALKTGAETDCSGATHPPNHRDFTLLERAPLLEILGVAWEGQRQVMDPVGTSTATTSLLTLSYNQRIVERFVFRGWGRYFLSMTSMRLPNGSLT